MSNLLKKDKGFTLIEIVLVLAIAGLLLVIIFLAVSGAQKARRDSQRKNDAARIASQVENYSANNGGVPPTLAQMTGTVVAAGSTYFNTTTDPDPSGVAYGVINGAGLTAATTGAIGNVWYATGKFCPATAGAPSARNYIVAVALEQGNFYCVDNH